MIDRATLYPSPEDWRREVEQQRRRRIGVICFDWHAGRRIPDAIGMPLMYIRVLTPDDQAELHRVYARLGYVAELLASDADADYWRFQHPDGPRP